jgi:hypothetical protein
VITLPCLLYSIRLTVLLTLAVPKLSADLNPTSFHRRRRMAQGYEAAGYVRRASD